ncbi:nuclear transport factor 2 family protein [Pseudacidovorax intermedius]|uniref:nuclear transport factor 2 family protein n=1 Tax=Pseudacidovorax intermedius TaxID=433924 RepID=UPI0026F07674|nr:nuclear transport factor 2 family protein [Pseudacidovorax intermedius]
MTHSVNQDLEALQRRIDLLERRIARAEDTEAIERLTRMYGYYLDKALWSEIIDLFTEDCTVEISALGVYVGRERAAQLFRDILGKGPAMSDENGLVWGRLYNHLIVQGIVHLDEDGLGASGRWRCFMQIAEFGAKATWGEGPYEIRYRKEGGVWKLHRLHFYRTYHTPFDEGWAKARSPQGDLRLRHQPDLPPSVDYEPYPAAFVPRFHYANPVSGSRAYTRDDIEAV